MSKYIPPNLLEKAREVDLLTFLKTYYPDEVVKETSTQYCTKTHDSLKMSNGFWNWCSRGIGGRNAMDFLEKTQNMKFPDNAEFILNKMQLQMPILEKKQEKRVQNLILPDKNDNENRTIHYLKSRGIDEEIIQKCIENKLIYEEKNYHNVVFVGYDEQKIARYAGCRSTDSVFKNDATGSNKMYSFKLEGRQETDKIFVFEGAIDLLSYATLFKLYGQNWEDKTMISLAGIYQPAKILEQSKVPLALQNYLEKHPEINTICLCLDNDLAGRNASKALKTVLQDKYKIIDKPPKKR